MPLGRRRNLLNVKSQFELWIKLAELFEKHGDCPLFRTELKKTKLLAKATLQKHAAKKTRKDITL